MGENFERFVELKNQDLKIIEWLYAEFFQGAFREIHSGKLKAKVVKWYLCVDVSLYYKPKMF